MKIAVAGKGGVGKTFIAGSLAGYFAHAGRPVIAIDADSSPNLAATLGMEIEEAARIVPIAENADLIRLKTGTTYSGVFRLTFSVDDIIAKFAVPTPSGASLMVMGTVKAVGSGCSCPAHAVTDALLRHLVVERDEIVIMDMEAGVEHLGRGTTGHVDTLLIVTDANRKSLEVAKTIHRLAKNSGIGRAGIVANRITGELQKSIVENFAKANGIEILAMIPYDPTVAEAGISGSDVPAGSEAVCGIGALAESLSGTKPVSGSGTGAGGRS